MRGTYGGVRGSDVIHKRGERLLIGVESHSGLRVALNSLGDGYVEAVPDSELRAIARAQVTRTGGAIHGNRTQVSLPQANGRTKAMGKFGWKAQHASLLSAVADALNNELGVPNRYFPANTDVPKSSDSNGGLGELSALVTFVRSTEPIASDPLRAATTSAKAGAKIFDRIGCSICHVETLKTAPPGTRMSGGQDVVSERIGNKEIHPFSDFLLHDVGTGDGIVQNIRPQDYDESTANKFRTAPLWGVRYRSWLMHDGKSVTYHQAIMRHAGEASGVVQYYVNLTPLEKEQLRRFLDSL